MRPHLPRSLTLLAGPLCCLMLACFHDLRKPDPRELDAAMAPDPDRGGSGDASSGLPDAGNPPRDGATNDTESAADVATSADTAGADAVPNASPDMAPAPPPDMNPACTNTCEAGSSRCGSKGPQLCVTGADGCRTWSAEATCPPPQACLVSGGTAACGCAPTCTIGQARCAATGIQDCVMQNGCPAWAAPRACPTTCKETGSTATCCGDGVRAGGEKCDGGSAASTELGACNPECTGFYEKKTIKPTQSGVPGNMGGPAGGDQFCRTEFGDGWKALLVGGGRRATVTPNRGDGQTDWVISKFTHYYNAEGQLLWRTDSVPLLGVREGQRMNIYADAFPQTGTYPWGGYASDWTAIPERNGPDVYSGTCGGWARSSMDVWGTFSFKDLTAAEMEPCAKRLPLLCVEQ